MNRRVIFDTTPTAVAPPSSRPAASSVRMQSSYAKHERSEYAKAVKGSYIKTKTPDQFKSYVSKELPTYKVNEALSDDSAVVYDTPEEVLITYKGTVMPWDNAHQSVKDVLADVDIARGIASLNTIPAQRHAEMTYLKTRAHYPNKKLVVAGHSLGANLSWHVATKYNVEGHHYAAPIITNPFKEHKNQTIYTAKSTKLPFIYGDPVAELSRTANAKKVVIPVNKFWTHGIDNFIDERSSPLLTATKAVSEAIVDKYSTVANDIRIKRKKYRKSK